ncbi:hypothetical protein C0991_004304, partial [Blastosporella zonata]
AIVNLTATNSRQHSSKHAKQNVKMLNNKGKKRQEQANAASNDSKDDISEFAGNASTRSLDHTDPSLPMLTWFGLQTQALLAT